MRLVEIHLEVDDIEKSLALYARLIPHHDIKRWKDGSAVALVLADGSALGLWKKGIFGIHRGQGGQHVHFAFQISLDEYDHYKTLIEKAGLEPLEHVWPGGHKSVYFFDHDGHQGEFITTDWITLGTS